MIKGKIYYQINKYLKLFNSKINLKEYHKKYYWVK